MDKIEAFIFDLDGVIVDTAKYHFIAWQSLANQLGFEFTLEDNERLKGVSRMRSLEILLEVGGKTLSQIEMNRMAEEKNTLYLTYITKMGKEEILPGVVSFLRASRDMGIKIALGSASKNAPLILEQLELTNMFDAIIDGNSVAKAKPDPEVFLKGAKILQVQPGNCVVFEDAEAGVEAALAGNMWCVGIGEQDNLSSANAVIPGFEGWTPDRLLAKITQL